MPYPPFPSAPAPITWDKGGFLNAALLRSDVANAVLLLSEPPLFAGAQTGGQPIPFSATSSATVIIAPEAAWQIGQPVTPSGSSLPSPLTAGAIYYVTSVNPPSFGIGPTAGGSGYTFGAGSGTMLPAQPVLANSHTPVIMDTQVTDLWGTHLPGGTQPAFSYAMFPGWYLAEASTPGAHAGSLGSYSAGVTAQVGAAAPQTWGGQRMLPPSSFPQVSAPSCAKLLPFSVTGNPGAAGNNYACADFWQSTNATPALAVTATRYPTFSLTWVSALSGNPLLPVPDNDTWPAPPLWPGRTFLNKNIRDAISFLIFPPVAEMCYAAGIQSLASQSSLPAVGTTVHLDTVTVDTRSGWNAGTYTWRAPVPGVYYLYGQAPVASATTQVAVAAGLTVTSANYGGPAVTFWGGTQQAVNLSGEVSCAVVRRHLRLNAGDLVSLAAFQNDSGANSAVIQGGVWQPRLIAVWRAA